MFNTMYTMWLSVKHLCVQLECYGGGTLHNHYALQPLSSQISISGKRVASTCVCGGHM